MSRRPDYNSLTAGDQTLQDEEAISATGEGDEEMEDAAEQEEEGYSACNAPRPSTSYSDRCNLLKSITLPLIAHVSIPRRLFLQAPPPQLPH